MKAASKNCRIITYGEVFSKLETTGLREAVRGVSVSRKWSPPGGRARDTSEYLLISSGEMNEAFAKSFRRHATQATRLLVILKEGMSADRLLSRILDLQIRTPQRCYLVETQYCPEKSKHGAVVFDLLKRLSLAITAEDRQERIFDARIQNDMLHVVSPDFTRLDVPIAEITQLKNADPAQIQKFEIDEDGTFIHWPALGLHLGWPQLQQIINPEAARKALQKSQQFNVRYGKAVQKVRENAGLKAADITGLSEKQLGRIETGGCRLTSNAIEALSKAHGLKANEYLQKLAEAIST